MSRLHEAFAAAKAEGRALLIGYMPAGFPSKGDDVEVIAAMVRGGVDAARSPTRPNSAGGWPRLSCLWSWEESSNSGFRSVRMRNRAPAASPRSKPAGSSPRRWGWHVPAASRASPVKTRLPRFA